MRSKTYTCHIQSNRADDKSAAEYNLEGGSTLHLVLALRGGAGAGDVL